MARLSQTIAGVNFKNPLIVASGPLTRKASLIKLADEYGAAGVSTKLCLTKQPFHGHSRWYFDWETKSMGACGERRLDLEEGEALIRQARKETSLVILANMSGSSDDIKTWGETAKRLEQAGAHFIELNMVCPNLGMSKQLQAANSQSVPFGAMVGGDPILAAAVTQCVKAAVSIPVSCKLTTVNSRIVEVARACEEAGADVLTISSGALGSPGLDIYGGGKPKVAGIGDKFACGGAGGPWAHAISNRAVADIRRETHLPIIGVGGIWKWEHIVESIMYGSSLVQACISIMAKGFKLISQWQQGLESFLDETGYPDISSFSGITLKRICQPKDVIIIPVISHVNKEKCTGCGSCLNIGHCDAIEMKNEKAQVNKDNCIGCGMCAAICPGAAITLL